MDKIPKNIETIHPAEIGGGEQKPTDGTGDLGHAIKPVVGEKQLPRSLDNKNIKKKISERFITSDYSTGCIQNTDLNNSESVSESDSSGYESEEGRGFRADLYLDKNIESAKISEKAFEEMSLLADIWLQRDNLDWDKHDDSKLDISEFTDPIYDPTANKSSRIRAAYEIGLNFADVIPSALGMVLVQQMQQKNIPLENVSEEVFNQELNDLLKDMKGRGVGFSSKVGETEPHSVLQKNTGRHVKDFTRDYCELQELDNLFDQYLNSGECSVWDAAKPLYRGGSSPNERKVVRNLEKEKPGFRRDVINRGATSFGYGLYYAEKMQMAKEYAQKTGKQSPVILTSYLKKGVPFIKLDGMLKIFKKKGLEKDFRLGWDYYLRRYVKHAVIIEVQPSDHKDGAIYTLSKGDVINQVLMQSEGKANGSGPQSFGALSIHRLDQSGRILGHPSTFEEVTVKNDDDFQITNFKAYGYKNNQTLPVFRYTVEGKELYVSASPEKEKTYWLVKQMPESLEKEQPEFIVEPTQDFLKRRKQEKLDVMHSVENLDKLEKAAAESRELVRTFFDVACHIAKDIPIRDIV